MRRLAPDAGIAERLLDGRATDPFDAVLIARVERALAREAPDPLYRRRLRGSVVNYYVASREGHLHRAPRPRRGMGTMGRSVLYASLVLAIGASAVGAVSQNSFPGDPLYAVKLRLEEIRMRIAPAAVRDALAALAVAERVEELEELTARGAWRLVPAAADRLVLAEAQLGSTAAGPAAPVASTAQAVEVLQQALVAAPDAAQAGLERALEATTGSATGVPAGSPEARGPEASDRGRKAEEAPGHRGRGRSADSD